MKKEEVTIRISGEQGMGVQSSGILLSRIFAKKGFYIFTSNDYESRIRGGYSFVQVRVSEKEFFSINKSPDICIPLSESAIHHDRETITLETLMLLDTKKLVNKLPDGYRIVDVPLSEVLTSTEKIYSSAYYIGLILAMIGIDTNGIEDIVREHFVGKPDELINKNIEILLKGFDYKSNQRDAGPNLSYLTDNPIIFSKKEYIADSESKIDSIRDEFTLYPASNNSPHELITNKIIDGNYAISLGAFVAGCKFYSSYPMSPSTSIMNYLAELPKEYGIHVEQAEDEIAAINLSLGASYAGARSMVGSSGGGIALMNETISLTAITEVPLVIVDAQRPAPATGLPTRTEQADLLFILHSGHGEFLRVIFAPGNCEQAFYLTQKAFYLSEKYRVPVFILTDKYLADSVEIAKNLNVVEEFQSRFIYEPKTIEEEENYKSYELTKNGVSKRILPGFSNAPAFSDSHTHDEFGNIAEGSEIRTKMVEKLFNKGINLINDISEPYLSDNEIADNLLIGWGSTFGVMRDACIMLKERGISVRHLHFHEVYPLQTKLLKKVCSQSKKVIIIENNYTSQMAQLIRVETGIEITEKILKYDGRPFYLDELSRKIQEKVS